MSVVEGFKTRSFGFRNFSLEILISLLLPTNGLALTLIAPPQGDNRNSQEPDIMSVDEDFKPEVVPLFRFRQHFESL
jgi:hypothetical protein